MPVFTKGDKAVLYVHVPKAGGSAVENHFLDAGYTMAYRDGATGPGTINRLRKCSPQHMHAKLCAQNFRLGRFDAIFTVVRDPIARFRSEYSMRTKAVDVSADAVDRWAQDVFQRYRKNPYVLDNHIRPQAEFVLPGAVVHRLEDGLDDLMATLDQRFDLGIRHQVKRVRTSEKVSGVSSGSVQISETLESRLRDFYADDFSTFGY